MLSNLQISARAAVVGVIDPDAYAAGTVTTGWIDISEWGWLMAIIMAGDLGTSATLDAKFQQATDSSGTGAKDISGLAVTQLTQAGSGSNKQAQINISGEDTDFNNGFHFVRLSMTVATATSDAGAVVIGMDARYGTADASDAASVSEIVS
ncbi:MAG: hypothetical protein CMN73_04320 [Sphingomonas sp.]|nr:hypothetical protein [Sphingomonas sp.]|tara:strand:- start:310 stop:762 length:453 start_codon:yes stop_codon:yes gene_type:complete